MTTEPQTPDVFDQIDALTLAYGLDWPELRRAGRLTDAMIAEVVAAYRERVTLTMLERADPVADPFRDEALSQAQNILDQHWPEIAPLVAAPAAPVPTAPEIVAPAAPVPTAPEIVAPAPAPTFSAVVTHILSSSPCSAVRYAPATAGSRRIEEVFAGLAMLVTGGALLTAGAVTILLMAAAFGWLP